MNDQKNIDDLLIATRN